MKKVMSILVLIIGIWGFIGCTEKHKEGGATSIEYNFEEGIKGWSAVGNASIAQDKIQYHEGKASLKITGVGKANLWSFAQSDKIPVSSGKRYRLAGWMLIDSISDQTSWFKCEFYQDGGWFQNKESSLYDMKMKGQWQQLTAEFIVPEGKNVTADIAVEKRPMEKDVKATMYIDSIKLEMIK